MDISDEIRYQIKHRKLCKACSLYGNENVISFGPKNCDILFVGLNPGNEEVIEDRPFVGKAGQILQTGIIQARIQNLKIAYTNSILCSTPNESAIPSVSNCVAMCKKLVKQIIEYHNPKVIGSLGVGATKFLFKIDKKITTIHGQVFKKDYTIVPLIHPSALRYGAISRDEFIQDLKVLKKIVIGKDERS